MEKESKVPINENQFGKLDYQWWKSICYEEILKAVTIPKKMINYKRKTDGE